MDGRKGLQRLFRWPRQRPEPGAVDPADVGTAFGMELSMEEAAGNDAAASSPDYSPARTGAQESDRLKRR
jgi:hypothetical protein